MDAMIPCSSLPLGRADRLGRRDQVRTRALERLRDRRVVGPVAREAVDLVHDDEVHRTFLDVLQLPLKLGSLDRCAGAAALDELHDDERAHLQRASLVRLPLRRDRQPLRLRTPSCLIEGGDTDIGHGPKRGQRTLCGCNSHGPTLRGPDARYVRGGGVSPWLNTGSR